MANKIFIISVFVLLFIGSCCFPWQDCADECDELDEFGDQLYLEVPVTVYPDIDTFKVGDTIYIDARFTKDINIFNSDHSIYLAGFDFLLEVAISEVVDSQELAVYDIKLFEEIGEIDTFLLHGITTFPIKFMETDSTSVVSGYKSNIFSWLEEGGCWLLVFDFITN